MIETYPHSDITKRVIGCAMEVHGVLGNGFQELIYQRELAVEMAEQRLELARELEMPLFYEGVDIGTRRADFLAKGTVLVEIKALIALEDVHLAQAINYLEGYHLLVGLLLNFGARSLEFKRVINRKLL